MIVRVILCPTLQIDGSGYTYLVIMLISGEAFPYVSVAYDKRCSVLLPVNVDEFFHIVDPKHLGAFKS